MSEFPDRPQDVEARWENRNYGQLNVILNNISALASEELKRLHKIYPAKDLLIYLPNQHMVQTDNDSVIELKLVIRLK